MSSLFRPFAMFLAAGSALVASAPGTASAQEANGFGEKGELIVSVDRLVPLLSYSSEKVTESGTNHTTTDSGTSAVFLLGREPSLSVVHTVPRVAFDYVVVRHLTLGGAFAFALGLGGTHEEQLGTNGNNTTRTTDTPKNTIIGFAPRVGYVLPIGHLLAFWPRAGFAFYSVSQKSTGSNNGNDFTTTNSDTVFSLDLDPQLTWVPVEHFFVHFGPLINIPIGGSRSVETVTGNTTSTTKNDLSVFHFGLSAGLGGWFDL